MPDELDCQHKDSHTCATINGLLDVLARPWTMHIFWVLTNHGPVRFGELRRQIEGVSARVLTERLRMLEQQGLVYRHYEATIPPAVTYGLTERIKDIRQIMELLNQLAGKWQVEDAGKPKPKAAQTPRTSRSKTLAHAK